MAKSETLKFYRCKHCGNIVQMVYASGVPVVCCGEPMEELVPNTVDAAQEKHVPVVSMENGAVAVAVGEVAHPMSEEHHIAWIELQTDRGVSRRILSPGQTPTAQFLLSEGERPKAVYAYCNLHGLWKTEL